jgi:hypothetical protein
MDDEIAEVDKEADIADPDATFPPNRDVVTQNYDLVVGSLMQQIESDDIVLRPSFQRGYVWSNPTASRLIESIILNVPIPPCYLSQNDEFELDVIDGQQRLQSIYRFIDNQFALSSLAISTEFNNLRFHQLPNKVQRQIKTHTIRCVMITNKSHPDVKFDIFERLNSNTSTLNAQELRNCIYRGNFNDLLRKIAEKPTWLKILGRKTADKRMKGEETILRHFAFKNLGLKTYRTPLKNWLNDAADNGRKLRMDQINKLEMDWEHMISISTIWFSSEECFRRPKNKQINKALFDLVSLAASRSTMDRAMQNRTKFRESYFDILKNEEFVDLISRSVDHKKRTERRFKLWQDNFNWLEQ